eukprot:CCRYP_006694-RA/>CCRYP_006694-RA protein AED:0.46 eAED:0.46 QI:0/0/0/1/0/0/2/0/87
MRARPWNRQEQDRFSDAFAVAWWARHLELEACLWLSQNGNTHEDEAAVIHCIRQAKAAQYFAVRKNFFWCFPGEWRQDFRDGNKIWE